MPKFTKLEDAMNWTDTAGGWTIETAGPVYWSTDDEDVALLLVSFLTDGNVSRAMAVVNHEATTADITPLINREFINKVAPLNPVDVSYSPEVYAAVSDLLNEAAAAGQRIVVLTQRIVDLEQQLAKER